LSEGFKAQALHEYHDADGNILYWLIRAKHPDGRKYIRPMFTNGSGYRLGLPDFPDSKPIYRLLTLATDTAATVWIVEGERCADRLAKLELIEPPHPVEPRAREKSIGRL